MSSGLIPTLNSMGFVFENAAEEVVVRDFLAFIGKGDSVLEIGCGTGVVVREALKKGVRVTANDLDPRHLKILEDQTPSSYKDLYSLVPGSFPESLDFRTDSFRAVLSSRMMHFLQPTELRKGVLKLSKWLEPGGKVFVLASGPYWKNTQEFVRKYEERKKKGEEWPGVMNPSEEKTFRDEVTANQFPKLMHLLDPEVLVREFERTGLVVESCEFLKTLSVEGDPDALDGREHVGLVARKPL